MERKPKHFFSIGMTQLFLQPQPPLQLHSCTRTAISALCTQLNKYPRLHQNFSHHFNSSSCCIYFGLKIPSIHERTNGRTNEYEYILHAHLNFHILLGNSSPSSGCYCHHHHHPHHSFHVLFHIILTLLNLFIAFRVYYL